ncbi:uncharacterized protein LOC5501569 [Nematostella vectensis]|uniref:uncharacterized protein LOC5501569 n=1 Tax=Nematostella vectensis TaxID=45351 RepID=UPI0013905EEE|nr:uncharacterized protein LOC5501569 [Nematostella vectensis]
MQGTGPAAMPDSEIQINGSSYSGSAASRDSSPSAASELATVVTKLLQSSLQPSSMPIYKRAWNLFSQFIYATNIAFSATLPISPPTLPLFIAYLFDKNYAPATVNTYVSALGYFHRLSDLPDPSKAFFILQMLKGYGKIGFRLDSGLPITFPILHRLVEAANNFSLSSFLIARFQAMCLLAFHAFLRVGEITTSSGNKGNPPLAIHQITKMFNEQKEIVALKLTFGNFKQLQSAPIFNRSLA